MRKILKKKIMRKKNLKCKHRQRRLYRLERNRYQLDLLLAKNNKKNKLRFKFTTKRPIREEDLVQIKGEIAARKPQKRLCIREVE